jgi:4'-phosphopantetheinyl transferase
MLVLALFIYSQPNKMPSIECKQSTAIDWNKNFHHPTALASSAQVFKVNIANSLAYSKQFTSILNDHEIQRWRRYHQEKDQQRYLVSRAVLKLMIGGYLNIPASEVMIGVGLNKKPIISNKETGRLQYNLTHSGEWILIAFSNSMIGIDQEYIDQHFEFQQLLVRCFSQAEQKSILAAADSRMQFYKYWTRKEALVKATGKGIDESLPLVPCMDGVWEIPFLMQGTDNWQVESFTIDENYIVAIAHPFAQKKILFMEQDLSSIL